MTKRLDAAQWLLLIAAFLTPLMAGQLSLDALPLIGGLGSVVGTLVGGPEAPLLSHALLAFLVVASLVTTLLGRRIVQVPNNTVGGLLLIFLALIAVSPALSSFKAISVAAAVEWLAFGVAFYAAVACLGRRTGPFLIVGAIFGGCVLLALLGLAEYGANKGIDPHWRIFALWNNPNALAVMLLVGFVAGLGLLLLQERVSALLIGLGTALIGLAIVLTQSKGGLLVMGGASVAMCVVSAAIARGTTRMATVGRVVGVLVAVVGLAMLVNLQARTATAQAGSALGRLADASASSDQSAGFRKLLWRTSLDLIKGNPVGYGVGSFRFESSRPGLTTQTVYAHNAYLQLGVEASFLAPLLFLVFVAFWAYVAYRGFRTLPTERRILLTTVSVAIGTVLAHSLIDSDLYYFGVGLSVFMLLGAGLLVSADSVAPEFLFPALRRGASGIVAALAAVFLYFGYVDALRADVRGGIATRNAESAMGSLHTLQSIAPADGEVWYMTSQLAASPSERLAALVQAVDNAPSTRNLRALARAYAEEKEIGKATYTLDKALQRDPNNLLALYELASVHRQNGDVDEYRKTLARLVDVENTTYYKVRSLPELVPTETYQARVELTGLTTDRSQQIKLLSGAVEGFRSYLAKTIPNVLRMSKSDPPADYAGETLEKAKAKMEIAAAAAQRLAVLLRGTGDAVGATKAEADAAAFAGAIK